VCGSTADTRISSRSDGAILWAALGILPSARSSAAQKVSPIARRYLSIPSLSRPTEYSEAQRNATLFEPSQRPGFLTNPRGWDEVTQSWYPAGTSEKHTAQIVRESEHAHP
jgi:hypothetical protein